MSAGPGTAAFAALARPRATALRNAAAAPRRPIIGFAPNHWCDGWSSRRRILEGLADRGWPTLYSSGARTVWDLGRPVWRTQPWLQTIARHANLRIDQPGRLILRWPTRPLCDRIALAAHAKRLPRAFGSRAAGAPIALLFHPAFWPYVRHLRPSRVVYYVYDAYRLMPGWTEELARHEEELASRADLIVAYSQGMLDGLPGHAAQRGRILATGVDMEPFEPGSAECPADLARVPGPRIGYVGRINQKLDYALVLEVAQRRPQWHWVFVGAIGADANGRFAVDAQAEALWSRCRALPNVHVLGPKEHDEVPSYLLNMDVNVMCYRTQGEGWWSRIFPLKSMEYLAAGKPVVSTPVKSMLRFGDNLAIATSAGEWIDAIDHALGAGGVGTPASRRETARANTWDRKIDSLHEWLLELVEDGRRPVRA